MKASRRKFLKQGSLASAASLWSVYLKSADLPLRKIASPDLSNKQGAVNCRILYTADLHAQLFTHDEFFWEQNQPVFRRRGGMDVLKSTIEYYRAQDPDRTILIDGGDFFHGHALSTLTEGEALIEIMNEMGYDMIVPGNWEVVYKKEKMMFDLGHALAAKCCANMRHQETGNPFDELVFPPYWIKQVDGVKLGFIGYTDHLIPRRQSPAYSKGLSFSHPDASLGYYVNYLRTVEGCEAVMVVTHIGLAQQMALADNPVCKGVDFILGADTHERVRRPLQGKFTRVVECGAFGSFLGKLDLTFLEGRLQDFSYELIDVDPIKFPGNKDLKNRIEKSYRPYLPKMKEVLGFTQTSLTRYFVLETTMDNLITDAIWWKLKPDIALSNGFRFCQPLFVDPAIGKAAITREFLFNMLPVDAVAKLGIVTGQQIWNWYEKELENAFAPNAARRFGGWLVRYAGMEANFTISKPFGQRLNHILIGGEPIVMEKKYTISACDREGDPDNVLCRMDGVEQVSNTELSIHQIIEAYLKKHSPVTPKIEGRAHATDEPQHLLTQVKGIDYEFT